MKDFEESLNGIRERWKVRRDGGKGSGNWGHAGRPGKVGGSQENNNSFLYRYTDAKTGGYTSWAKEKKKAATPHLPSANELNNLPKGSIIIDGGEVYEKIENGSWGDDAKWQNVYTKEIFNAADLNRSKFWEKEVKVAIPEEAVLDHMLMTEMSGSPIGTKKAKKDEPYNPPMPKSVEGPAKNTTVFGDGHYSPERLAKAKKFSKYESFKTMVPVAASQWENLTHDQKRSLYNYTGSDSWSMNKSLGQKKCNSEIVRDEINDVTHALDTTYVPMDCWVSHGISSKSFASTFGLKEKITGDPFYSMVERLKYFSGQLKDKVGKVGYNPTFFSCAMDEGNNAADREIILDIFVPKGSKGLYIEPISMYGQDKGPSWDGDYSEFPEEIDDTDENEILLQRGGYYKILGYKLDETTKRLRVQCALVGQDPSKVKI